MPKLHLPPPSRIHGAPQKINRSLWTPQGGWALAAYTKAAEGTGLEAAFGELPSAVGTAVPGRSAAGRMCSGTLPVCWETVLSAGCKSLLRGATVPAGDSDGVRLRNKTSEGSSTCPVGRAWPPSLVRGLQVSALTVL